MYGGMQDDSGIRPLDATADQAVSSGRSIRRTVALILFGWAAAAGTAGVAYLALGHEVVPIAVGVVLCLAFGILLSLLHRAIWLAVLSALPSLFVLVGAVQYAPEAALELRGVRETVVIVADSAEGTSSKNHRFTLRRASGDERELDEKLEYNGNAWAPKVGDRLDVTRDPEGKVPMEQAEEVDAAGRLGSLIAGTVTWTLMAMLAGRRGHVRRRKGRASLLDEI
jgi:hypothetical protein